ncbi:MAG: hypothetical protein DMF60_20875, partial [Acidobacteria bacterium]
KTIAELHRTGQHWFQTNIFGHNPRSVFHRPQTGYNLRRPPDMTQSRSYALEIHTCGFSLREFSMPVGAMLE